MSVIDQLKEELKNLSPEERNEFLKDLKAPEVKPKPTEISLGKPMSNPYYFDEYGRKLSEEEAYDLNHPMADLWIHGRTETIDNRFAGGKRTVRKIPDAEVNAHNEEIRKAWIQAKRAYAAEHGLTFSDDYNPPKKRSRDGLQRVETHTDVIPMEMI